MKPNKEEKQNTSALTYQPHLGPPRTYNLADADLLDLDDDLDLPSCVKTPVISKQSPLSSSPPTPTPPPAPQTQSQYTCDRLKAVIDVNKKASESKPEISSPQATEQSSHAGKTTPISTKHSPGSSVLLDTKTPTGSAMFTNLAQKSMLQTPGFRTPVASSSQHQQEQDDNEPVSPPPSKKQKLSPPVQVSTLPSSPPPPPAPSRSLGSYHTQTLDVNSDSQSGKHSKAAQAPPQTVSTTISDDDFPDEPKTPPQRAFVSFSTVSPIKLDCIPGPAGSLPKIDSAPTSFSQISPCCNTPPSKLLIHAKLLKVVI